jgi:hypothetical protein
LREAADREIEQRRRLIEFAAGREHTGRGGAGFGTDFGGGIQELDADLVASQSPGDGCADDAAADDDDVEVSRHGRY